MLGHRLIAALAQVRCPMERRDRGVSEESPDHSPKSPRILLRAPNWTVLEKMSAGRWACAGSECPSREASAEGIPEALARRLASSAFSTPRFRWTTHAIRPGGAAAVKRTRGYPTAWLARLPSPMAPQSLPARAVDGGPLRKDRFALVSAGVHQTSPNPGSGGYGFGGTRPGCGGTVTAQPFAPADESGVKPEQPRQLFGL
jgi:hypothetical protein